MPLVVSVAGMYEQSKGACTDRQLPLAQADLENVQHDGDEQPAGAQHDDEGHGDDVQRDLRHKPRA